VAMGRGGFARGRGEASELVREPERRAGSSSSRRPAWRGSLTCQSGRRFSMAAKRDAVTGEAMVGRVVVSGDEHPRDQGPAEKPGQAEARLDIELQLSLEGLFHVTRPNGRRVARRPPPSE
jgi:hypothetical protein